MNISDDIINQQAERVQRLFRYWRQYMEERVEFWKIPGDLDIHTQGHCERVLMHALRIGEARHANDGQMTALAMASVYHDTRRKDNYLDTGHGSRAAAYLKASTPTPPDNYTDERISYIRKMAYAAVFYHDLDDQLGEEYIRTHFKDNKEQDETMEVYHIFKDADALDRLRLGTWCLDPWFLRTKEAKGMQPFAQMLVEKTIPRDELEQTYRLTDPFRNRM